MSRLAENSIYIVIKYLEEILRNAFDMWFISFHKIP